MPNFKKEGRGFKMKGFTAFTKAETPMKKPLVGDQNKLPENLKQKILDAPMKMYDKSSMKMYDKSAMKKYGKSPMKKDDDKKKNMEPQPPDPDREDGGFETQAELDAFLKRLKEWRAKNKPTKTPNIAKK